MFETILLKTGQTKPVDQYTTTVEQTIQDQQRNK